MPIKDTTVVIDLQKPSKLVALGKPLLLAKFAGPSTYKTFYELEDVETAFGIDTIIYKIAKSLLKQGDSSPAEMAIATYDPTGEPKTNAVDVLKKHYNEDWFFLVADTQVVAEIKTLAGYLEMEKFKMYGATVATVDDLTALSKELYDFTFIAVHERVDEYIAEGLIGGVGSKPVGSTSWRHKKIAFAKPSDASGSEVKAIKKLNGMTYSFVQGDPETTDSKTVSGEWIDVMHSKAWIKTNVEKAVHTVFVTNDKVGFEDSDIALLALAVEGVLDEATKNRMISVTDNVPDYTVTTVSRADTPARDRDERVYRGLSFSFDLAGAIHEAEIKGLIKI